MTDSTPIAERAIVYVPFGEKTEITLTMQTVARYVACKTKKGHLPSNDELVKFMMLCRSRELNPFAGDAYLVGYDSHDGPVFSLLTAHQALQKRSEACPTFDGIEQGVIIRCSGGERIERAGDYVDDGETLLGGWAKCHRKDRSKPFCDTLNLATYDTGRSRWKKDPAGMIVKCAEASVLRAAFPTQVGGLYTEAEMSHVVEAGPKTQVAPKAGKALDQLVAAPAEASEADSSRSDVADVDWTAEVELAESVSELHAISQQIGASGLQPDQMESLDRRINARREELQTEAV